MCRYVPKVLRAQVITLQVFAPLDSQSTLHPLCPVQALRAYLDRSSHFRLSEQLFVCLFVCFGGRTKGLLVSEQWLSHWIVEAVALAYASKYETSVLLEFTLTPRGVWLLHGLGLEECQYLSGGRLVFTKHFC